MCRSIHSTIHYGHTSRPDLFTLHRVPPYTTKGQVEPPGGVARGCRPSFIVAPSGVPRLARALSSRIEPSYLKKPQLP
eukprot:scaffold9552_cov113-Isochrysis_galbana.AAC.5